MKKIFHSDICAYTICCLIEISPSWQILNRIVENYCLADNYLQAVIYCTAGIYYRNCSYYYGDLLAIIFSYPIARCIDYSILKYQIISLLGDIQNTGCPRELFTLFVLIIFCYRMGTFIICV